MTLHFPTSHMGYANHHLLRNALLAVGVVALALLVFGAAMLIQPITTPTTKVSEPQSLVEFRAGERADWANPITTEDQSLIDFRAAEREMR